MPVQPRCTWLTCVVRSVCSLTPRVTRVVLHAPGLDEFCFATQDQWVKLFFPLPGQRDPVVPQGDDWYARYRALPDDQRPPMRTYTIRSHDRDARTLTVDFVLHGDLGPASAWARRATPGDRLALYGPGHAYLPPHDADWILCLGDETALPAVSAIAESADNRHTLAYVEVADDAERLDLRTNGGACVRYLTRGGGCSATSTLLVDTLRDLSLPPGTPYVWLAGEASKVRAMRRHLVQERGLDRQRITFIGYWRAGQPEDAADHSE